MSKISVRPPYSVLYLFDPDSGGEAPEYDGSLSRANDTCAYFGTRSSDDGPVAIWIEEGRPNYEVKYEASYLLNSLHGRLFIETTDGEIVGKLLEKVGQRRIQICADDDREPVRISVWSIE